MDPSISRGYNNIRKACYNGTPGITMIPIKYSDHRNRSKVSTEATAKSKQMKRRQQ
jgi:hypothetical protein